MGTTDKSPGKNGGFVANPGSGHELGKADPVSKKPENGETAKRGSTSPKYLRQTAKKAESGEEKL